MQLEVDMSTQLTSYWEPIDAGRDVLDVYSGGDDKVHMDQNHRRRIIVDPTLQYSSMKYLLIVFVLASAIFFAAMSFAFLEIKMTVEMLQLPQEHQVFSDLRRIANATSLAFIAIFLGCAVLFIWGGLHFSRRKADAQQKCSATEI